MTNRTKYLTSAEWARQETYKHIIVMDPDGWDRQHYDYSWNEELISETEFNKRLTYSTTVMKRK